MDISMVLLNDAEIKAYQGYGLLGLQKFYCP